MSVWIGTGHTEPEARRKTLTNAHTADNTHTRVEGVATHGPIKTHAHTGTHVYSPAAHLFFFKAPLLCT